MRRAIQGVGVILLCMAAMAVPALGATFKGSASDGQGSRVTATAKVKGKKKVTLTVTGDLSRCDKGLETGPVQDRIQVTGGPFTTKLFKGISYGFGFRKVTRVQTANGAGELTVDVAAGVRAKRVDLVLEFSVESPWDVQQPFYQCGFLGDVKLKK